MHRLLRWQAPTFSLALATSLLLVTIWPQAARAAERLVGNGETSTELRKPGDFDAVQTHSLGVLVRQGSAPSVSVTADRNLLPLLETVVEDTRHGKTLVLRWKRGAQVQAKVVPQLLVTVVQLQALVVGGAARLQAEQINTPRLAVRVEGSGDLRLLGLTTDELALNVAGSGDVQASGQAKRLAVNIAGSGDVKTDGLKADDVRISIAGSGNVQVDAQRTLDVSIAGSGDVMYSGNAVVKKSVAGSGSVTKR